MKRDIYTLSILILLASLLAGCQFGPRANQLPFSTPVDSPTIPPNLTIPPPETPELQPTATSSPAPIYTATAAPSATVAVIAKQEAVVAATNLNLRQGPGTLFQIVTQLKEGSKVTVTGKAKGDDWLYVDTGKRKGWAAAAYVTLSNPIASVPEQPVTGVVMLQGQVLDKEGKPVDWVEFTAFQGRAKDPPSTRAHSLADGTFYLYLPATAKGTWRINLLTVGCTSRVMDKNCTYSGSIAPLFTDINLPTTKIIQFTYLPQ